MIELDDRLRVLQRAAREWGEELEELGAELDHDPDGVDRFTDVSAFRYVSRMMIPPEYQDSALHLSGHSFHGDRALERVVAVEALGRGDAGAFLAAPGPSLSGGLVALLGDTAQQKWFFEHFSDEPVWTFLGLTEPDHGSDASAMATTLTPEPGGDRATLTGEKRYVGNASRARLGTVFARTGPGPLGVSAVMVRTGTPGFHASPLPTIGLRGARVCAVRFDGVAVSGDQVLGRHLRASSRGMHAAVRMFNQFRPGVAALALGIAQAAHDYLSQHRSDLGPGGGHALADMEDRLVDTRQLVWRAAADVDHDPARGHLASAAKASAARLAEETTLRALELLGPGARFSHPRPEKLARDARGVEFMEGTTHVQRLNVAQGVVTGRIG
ncbi:acyl-CoA dehydrogenase family protein [Nocardiopsis tropica]|uniref:Acyl-CoA dehydrogenase family protein n=1 Tax=Nocardiopsis tropica TaxID=109330 RepID=A0ABU7KLB0_9ACTN|nr:acyl-CoA dehydrogenase family protein [Nocardiopsis umidischolae]MEE2050046.1 acyl-CoA dehydrogenase family protein [Nocardiopsis umidischolae]